MKSKRILSLLLSLMMALSAVTVFSENTGEEQADVISALPEVFANDESDLETNIEQPPYFESLEFMTTAFDSGAWVKGATFSPEKLEYDLPIKKYSTSSITLQAATAYDTEKYNAEAEYTDVNGEKQIVKVNSGKSTALPNQPFGSSVMTITVSDKENADNKTVYTFNVSRPRDTSNAVKPGGIVLSPDGRALSSTAYNGAAEGAMQKADESGALTSGTGVSTAQYYYRTFVYDDIDSFKLTLTPSTVYGHIRYSTDNGESWRELNQGGGVTDAVSMPQSGAAEIIIQIADDSAYYENNGFEETNPAQYKVWVDKVTLSSPKILTAASESGDWYPAFSPDMHSYCLIVDNAADAPVITFTVSEGCTVKVGAEEQTADENGIYTFAPGTAQTAVSVTSEDGSFANTYKFSYRKKSAFDVPDKVTDYLCIGSQYINGAGFGGVGINPEQNLCGSLKSLGNFGGYITYYYEEPITDNPNNKYGMDFYVTGNSSEQNIDSMAELGQVYVSEDGEKWYALAGSEHYEDKAVWDYTITYTKGDDGKAYWTDNYGNSIDYAAKAWPSAAYYYMNDAAEKDSYTFTGILFKSQLGSIMGDSTSTASFAASAKFGYADYYASNISGTSLKEVNSYAENPGKANGFDVAWAVDENGAPVDVRDMKFHYIKVATASNIWAGAFAEKSTEVSCVVRTTAQDTAVGKTDAPKGVTISDGADSKTISFTEGKNVYSADLGNMKYVSIKVNGTADDDNIYINNQRVSSNTAADGFKITKERGETLVRVIVQNGEKEPAIYLLKLSGSARDSEKIIDGIKINAGGTVREAASKDGIAYSARVGRSIDSISVVPVAAPGVSYTVNGNEPLYSYELISGENVFEIAAQDKDGKTQAVKLTVTKDSAPSSSGSGIIVTFALYGDERHDDSKVHTYKNDKGSMPVWIKQKTVSADYGATVLNVIEKVFGDENIVWKNDGGNYISEINGLAEFDNGALSGWMYTVNGIYPDFGIAEQTLKNGDKIILHYTDDYTQEKSSEKWSSGSTPGSITSGYTVNFETNGAGAVNSQSLNKNGVVSKPKDPEREGYIFAGWYVDKDLTEEYDFSSKVTGGLTLYAKWTEITADGENNTAEFEDVEKDSWYESAVSYVVENNLFDGVSKTRFEPHANMTRAMAAAVLYRLDNTGEKYENSGFADVPYDQWYFDAVSWAAKNNIVNGTSETEFSPEADITREQTAALLYRYAKYKNIPMEYDKTKISDLSGISNVSSYASEAVSWAVGMGIMNGKENGELDPQGTATRAETAVMLERMAKIIK